MTPSTLIIGTILKTKLSLKYLASSESPMRKSIAPLIVQLPTVSLGCCLPKRTTPFLSFKFEVIKGYFIDELFIEKNSTSLPIIVEHSFFLLKKVYISFSFFV